MTRWVEPPAAAVQEFYDYLVREAGGRENAIPARELAGALGLGANGDRALRALAHAANEAGLLVCADNNGYFVPEGPGEVDEAVGRLESQGRQMLGRARQLRTLAERKWPHEQLELWGRE